MHANFYYYNYFTMQRQQQQKREAKRYAEIKANLASTFKANYNVYKQDKQLIIGIWNEKKQIIEFVDDIDKHNQELKNLLTKYNVRIE